MKKSELKTGMIVEFNNEDIYLVMLGTGQGDVLCGGEPAGWMRMSDYKDDLSLDSGDADFSIKKVYGYPTMVSEYVDVSISNRKLLWENPSEVTVKLNKDHLAVVNKKDKKVKVGCQEFTFDRIEELYQATKK